MTPAHRLLSLALFLSLPVAVNAQEGSLARTLEMPAHNALMTIRADAELSAFETDGCSGGLSYGWGVAARNFPDFAEAHDHIPPWQECCVVHDRAYHIAGDSGSARESYDARLAADKALEICVKTTSADHIDEVAAHYDVSSETVEATYGRIAEAMYLAVRLGGAPCSGLPWRWGFGYPNCTVLDIMTPARE